MEFLLLLLPIIFIIASALITKKAVSRGAKRKKSVALQILSFAAVLICCTVFPMVAGAAEQLRLQQLLQLRQMVLAC